MSKANYKKGDVVFIISGADKGKSGKVLKVEPKKNRVFVEGVNLQKKAVRRSQTNQQGGFETKEGPIDMSNAMHEDKYNARLAKRANKQ